MLIQDHVLGKMTVTGFTSRKDFKN